MPAIWTAPRDWAYKDVFSASQANIQLRDNLMYLKKKPRDFITLNAVANVTASLLSASFAAVDDTKFTNNIVTSEANEEVFITIQGLFGLASAAQYLVFDWLLDSTLYISNMSVTPVVAGCAEELMITNSTLQHIFIRKRLIIPSVGAHTLKLRMKVSTTNTTLTIGTNGLTFEMGVQVE